MGVGRMADAKGGIHASGLFRPIRKTDRPLIKERLSLTYGNTREADAYPARLPLLPMRGVVVFPHTTLHFDEGRPKSLRALNEAMGRDQYLFLSTQKDMTVDDPDSGGMSPVGVVACVRQVLRLPGEGVRIMVEGQYRARIRDYIQTDPYHEVAVKECLERRPADRCAAWRWYGSVRLLLRPMRR